MAKVKTKIITGIGHSPLTDKIYLGRQNPEKGLWVGNDKKDITNSFIAVSLSYFRENHIRSIKLADSKITGNFIINCKNDKDSLERTIKALKLEIDAINKKAAKKKK